MEHRFDELAKALAGGLSRREVLRLGGGMAVALLATFGLGSAWGQNGGVACGNWCKSAVGYDPKNKASKERFVACVTSCEDCQEEGGHVCGTTTRGSVVCCERTDTCCGTGCCPAGQSCQAGQCVSLCPGSGSLSPGICSGPNATCACPAGSSCCQGTGLFADSHACCPAGSRCGHLGDDPVCLA